VAQSGACTAAWSARILEAVGPVELRRAASSDWTAAGIDDLLCENDSLRVGAYGRAAVVLQDDTVFRLDQFSTITLVPPRDDSRTWVELIRGITHIISRNPRALHVTTPFANAGIEGTEFRVEVTESRTSVDVLEGTVALSNASGSVAIEADQTASAETGAIASPRAMADPYASLDWTRYYPLVIDGSLPAPDTPVAATPAPLAARAQSRLAVGRVAEAEADIAQALAISSGDPDALAVRAMILLARSQTDAARQTLDQATNSGAPILLARSLLAQRRGDLEAAAEILREATEVHPENALAWARLAEIGVSLGDTAGGLAAAERADALDPGNVHSRIVRGFAALDAGDTGAAETAFREATRLAPSAPLGRLGLGLALIRTGALAEGRAEIENAVLLDAGDGLIRSYAAKAYYDERRTDLAASQLDAAKRLNPQSSTPYLYDALRKQNANEPVGAYQDLQRAAELNRDRTVFRSELRMDSDLATRSAGRGRIYRNLGFGRLALLEGWMSVNDDPSDFAGHRLLADMYSLLPRHQTARVNELYQAQLLEPATVTLTDPQLAEANLFLLNSVGPSDLSHSEFAPLINRDGVRFQGSGIAGGNDTRGDTVVVGGTHEQVDYSFGQFHYETDGFRENNDIDQDFLAATARYRPNERTGLLVEVRSNSLYKGDLLLRFDPENYNSLLRQRENATAFRLGGSVALSSRSRFVGSLAFEDADLDYTTGQSFASQYDIGNTTAQLLHLISSGSRWDLASGISVRSQDLEQRLEFSVPLPDPPFFVEQMTSIAEDLRFVSLYSYANVNLTRNLQITAGASADYLDGQDLKRDRLNPKLGFTWMMTPQTVVRGAAFKTLNGPVISKQIIQPSLEPTQVAGFNQFFFGPEGDETAQFGMAVDHRVSTTLHLGAEISRRDINSPTFIFTDPMSEPVLADQPIDESLLRAYLYWAPNSRIAIGATLENEDVDNHGEALAAEFTKLETIRLPMTLSYFSPSGFSAGLTATPVHQQGLFWNNMLPPDAPPIPGEDEFWVFDLSIGYRLPNRRGLVELTARNLFDEEFQFQDTDPETPRIFPERFVGLRFTLAY
jgi:tetratricopeptide (TPR) repeat protein